MTKFSFLMISQSGPTNDKKCENCLKLFSMTPYFTHTNTHSCSLHAPSSTLTTLASLTSCLSFFTFFCFNHIVSKSAEMWDNSYPDQVTWPRGSAVACVFVCCLFSVKGRGLVGWAGARFVGAGSCLECGNSKGREVWDWLLPCSSGVAVGTKHSPAAAGQSGVWIEFTDNENK